MRLPAYRDDIVAAPATLAEVALDIIVEELWRSANLELARSNSKEEVAAEGASERVYWRRGS